MSSLVRTAGNASSRFSGMHTALVTLMFLVACGAGARPATASEGAKTIEGLLVSSPVRIPSSAMSKPIRYRMSGSALRWEWPETSEQRVRRRVIAGETDTLEVTVCAHCRRPSVETAERLDALRQPTRFVDSTHPRVRVFARRHAGTGSLESRMRRLERALRSHMDGPVEYLRYAKASEALELRRGDCTEFAVALAALARASGIPARLVFGIAYASRFSHQSHVFTPHMWVQVWDGEAWRSFDAGLDGFRSGTVALALGDGSESDLSALKRMLGELRIDSATALRARPSSKSEVSAAE